MSWPTIMIAELFVFIGIVFLLLAATSILHTRNFLKQSTVGEGTVISIVTHPAEPIRMYSPQVVFMTTEGKEIEFIASVHSRKIEYTVGEKVPIRYERSRPEEATIDRAKQVWFLPVCLLSTGSVPRSLLRKNGPVACEYERFASDTEINCRLIPRSLLRGASFASTRRLNVAFGSLLVTTCKGFRLAWPS